MSGVEAEVISARSKEERRWRFFRSFLPTSVEARSRWATSPRLAGGNSDSSNQEETMAQIGYKTALVVGVGSGLSASLARALRKEGMEVALAARRANNLAALAGETGAKVLGCDATDGDQVSKLFVQLEQEFGAPDVVVYNASYRTRGPFLTLDPAEVEKSIAVSAFGGFLVAREAAKRMVPRGHGAILFTGASASAKGYAQSRPCRR
jgi:NAD(P)-dependent dehydrogenase (short-subunit alcohol dehydrogenase family)